MNKIQYHPTTLILPHPRQMPRPNSNQFKSIRFTFVIPGLRTHGFCYIVLSMQKTHNKHQSPVSLPWFFTGFHLKLAYRAPPRNLSKALIFQMFWKSWRRSFSQTYVKHCRKIIKNPELSLGIFYVYFVK